MEENGRSESKAGESEEFAGQHEAVSRSQMQKKTEKKTQKSGQTSDESVAQTERSKTGKKREFCFGLVCFELLFLF